MTSPVPQIAVVGGGPAGLMAAEVIAEHAREQVQIDLYDTMPSVGRKFLLAGRGGLNLTHAEAFEPFVSRYAERASQVQPWLAQWGAHELRQWVHGLGIDTFVGTSQRVFPTDMKAAPLLRAWLHRLRAQGVRLHARHRCIGLRDGRLQFETPQGLQTVQAHATVLALGGASWSRLGSDGAWQSWLRGTEVEPLKPSNCGFDVKNGWTAHLRERHAGQPVKPVVLRCTDSQGHTFERQGEFVVTASGVEGSLIYAASALLRDEIARTGQVTITLDLLPAHTPEQVLAHVKHPRGSKSWSNHLKSRLNLHGLKVALLHELLPAQTWHDAAQLAHAIKALPVVLTQTRPIDEAISSAGGVRLESLNEHLMIQSLPGVFCAGEMLDWEAPTGGYLLTATMSSARVAARGVLRWLHAQGLTK
jgi:uncharacterized flavoprotein (TIGR03862 family)